MIINQGKFVLDMGKSAEHHPIDVRNGNYLTLQAVKTEGSSLTSGAADVWTSLGIDAKDAMQIASVSGLNLASGIPVSVSVKDRTDAFVSVTTTEGGRKFDVHWALDDREA